MFAEDIGLIPKRCFTGLLDSVANAPEQFGPLAQTLWKEMDAGGFSVILRETLPRINGKLFKDTAALPLTREQIGQLQRAAQAEWTQVEPAIFGTLLTRSLDPAERHSLATVETAKHRIFQFLDAAIAPDNMLVCVALDDANALGVLSSRVHVVWALATGGRLGIGNDPRYNKSRCF